MDGSAFDRLVRHIGEGASRRGLLKSAFAASVAGLGVASVLDVEDAEAKSCKKKCNEKKDKQAKKQCKKNCQQCKPNGSPCVKDKQCCTGKTGRICEIPFGASNGDDKKCCPGLGATCTPPEGPGPYCCTGEQGGREFECGPNLTCQQVVDEP